MTDEALVLDPSDARKYTDLHYSSGGRRPWSSRRRSCRPGRGWR